MQRYLSLFLVLVFWVSLVGADTVEITYNNDTYELDRKIYEGTKISHPQLIDKIVSSLSMDYKEKNYWLTILSVMTQEQINELKDILNIEINKFEVIVKKYASNREIKDAEKKYHSKIVVKIKTQKDIIDGYSREKWSENDRIIFNKGMSAYKKGNYQASLEFFLESATIRKKTLGKEHTDTAISYNNIALLYNKMGDYPKALSYHHKALVIKEKVVGKEHLGTATSYNGIGSLYDTLGDYIKALIYYKKSLSIREKILGKEHTSTATSYSNIGELYHDIGEHKKSLSYHQKALAIYEKVLGEEHTNTAASYNNIGGLYISMGDYPKSLSYLQKALAIYEKVLGKEHTDTAASYNNIGLLYELMRDYPKSLSYYQQTLVIIKKVLGKEHIYTATSYNNIGGLYKSMGDYSKSLSYLQKALAINKKVLGKEHPNTATSYSNIGMLYESMKEYQKAYLYAKKSFDIFLINRDKNFQILNSSQKELYLKANSHQVPLLLSTAHLYKEHNATKPKQIEIAQQTLNAWLNYKGSIFDSENAITTLYETTKDSKLKEQIDKLRTAQRYYAKLQQNASKEKNYKEKIKTTTEEIEELTQDIASKAQSFREAEGLKDIKYQDISSTLADEQLYIDYAKAGKYYYIFTLDKKENITFTQIDSNDTKEIDSLVELFRADIQTMLKGLGKLTPQKLQALNQNSKETLAKLHTLLITKPLSQNIKEKTNLLISPDGALRLLPFEALYDSTTQKYLIEESDIEYIPSGKERVRLTRYNNKTKDTKRNSKLVLFTDPHYDDATKAKLAQWQKRSTGENQSIHNNELESALYGLPLFDRLRDTRKEAQFISELFGAEHIISYRARKSSEENLLKTKHPKILHLSTHGFFLNNPKILNPMLKSGLVFAGANIARKRYHNTDGIVTALKLSGMKLKNTDLVVLSACQTGVVDSNSTESVSGLSKAFIQAGAKSVLSTLWSVANKESTTLIEDFYKQIADKESYSVALKRAKLKMITQGKHPFFWGGFVLVGE